MCISGGEPLCYPDLQQVLRLCSEDGINVSVYTTGIANGSGHLHVLSDVVLDLLEETKATTIFSVHGALESTHEQVTRAAGSFRLTVRAIEKAVSRGLPVQMHVVPMAINLAELADIAYFAADTGVQQISWLRFVPQGRGDSIKNY